jgi:hypothetical protein
MHRSYRLTPDAVRILQQMDAGRDFVGVAHIKTGDVDILPGKTMRREIANPQLPANRNTYELRGQRIPVEHALDRNQATYRYVDDHQHAVVRNIPGHEKLLKILGEKPEDHKHVGFYGTKVNHQMVILGWNSNTCNTDICGTVQLSEKYRKKVTESFKRLAYTAWGEV